MREATMVRVVDGLRYDTEKSYVVAHNVYWDGNNYERDGRNKWLYRTENGRYFVVTRTMWQGERDSLEPVSEDAAVDLYTHDLPQQSLSYEDAFPGRAVDEA